MQTTVLQNINEREGELRKTTKFGFALAQPTRDVHSQILTDSESNPNHKFQIQNFES